MKRLNSFFLLTGALLFTQITLADIGVGVNPRPGSLPKEENVVHGVVVDAATKKPVPGVLVSASNQKKNIRKEVSTDASGYFKLDELPSGELLIYFDKKGYRMLKRSPFTLKDKSVLKLTIDLVEEEKDTVFEHPALRLMDGIFK